MSNFSLEAWANFFYKNRLAFRVSECPTFKTALALTRPGLEDRKSVLNRRSLAGVLLEKADERITQETRDIRRGKMCTTSQDGWSNIHNESIIASTIQSGGKSYPLDSVEPGTNIKTAEYCFKLAKQSILYAEERYEAEVVGFVSDNESKMVNTREHFH